MKATSEKVGSTWLRGVSIASLIFLITGIAAGCSGGLASIAPNETAPSVVVASANESRDNFATAVSFARWVHLHDYPQALRVTSPGSVAMRYIEHQKAFILAQQVNGDTTADDTEPTIQPDDHAKVIKIVDGDTTYTWKKFVFDIQGRVVSWTGASGPVAKALWSKSDQSEVLGAKARLVSAYRANSGYLFVVVEYTAIKPVLFNYGATYGASGSKENATAQGSTDALGAGEQKLAYYAFKGADFGGTFKVLIHNSAFTKSAKFALKVR